MSSDARSSDLDHLLRETRWVRALARRLATPEHDADDLVQEACLVALQRPPSRGDNLRGWLSKVLTNLVRQDRRSTRRRLARERDAGDDQRDPAPPTADLVERAATQRHVVDAVLALDEPYREAILLRYFEDLPPRAIAARLEVPVGTVRTRITRGLHRLRGRLDQRRGGRARWAAAALSLPPLNTPTLALLTMKTKSLVTGAVVLGALAVAAAVIEWRDPVDAGTSPNTPPAAERAERTTREAAATPATGPERADATPAATPSADPTAAAPARRAVGRVVDPEGRALAGLGVALGDVVGRVDERAPRATSDADARFELAVDAGRAGHVVVDEDGWSTVMSATVRAQDEPTLALVVAAPAVPLAGTVRDAQGRPLAGAEVRVVWPSDLRARQSLNSDAASERTATVRAADDGTFAIEAARVRGAELLTRAQGLVPDRRAVPEVGQRGLEIVLRAPTAQDGAVQGQVLDPRGVLIADARVALGGATVRSDERGGFVVEAEGDQLVAAHPGHQRAVFDKPETGWPPFVVLQLGDEPLTIRGRVVDADGEPVPRAKVWVTNATTHGRDRPPVVCEGVAASRVDMNELIARYRRGEIEDPEATIRDTPTTTWPFVLADERGAFELVGLEDRGYDLRAMSLETLLMHDVPAVPAGTRDVEVVLPTGDLFAELAGAVVAADGTPLPDVTVRLQCDAVSVGGSNLHAGTPQQVVTDERGRFRLEKVPHTRVYLRLDGEAILPVEYGRRVPGGLLELSGGAPEKLRVVASRRMHVQVTVSDASKADALCVYGVGDEPLPIDVFSGNSRRTTRTLSLENGRSPVFVIPETATTLALLQGDEELRREALILVPGQVNHLDY